MFQARRASIAMALGLCGCAALAGVLRGSADAARPAAYEEVDLPSLPSRVLGPLSFGMKVLLADLFFLDAVQINGGRHAKDPEEQQERADRGMAQRLLAAVDMDPHFEVAYRFAGSGLTRHTPDGGAYGVLTALELLRRGVDNCPNDWRIPFLLGFFDSYYLGHMGESAQAMAIAARRPGAPAYVGLLATRLAADEGELQTAEQMTITMMEQADTDEARAAWQARLLDVHMERDLRAIEAAAKRYKDKTGALPTSLEALVKSGELERVPAEPHGGRYEFDAATGDARSTAAERLRVRGRRGTTSGMEIRS